MTMKWTTLVDCVILMLLLSAIIGCQQEARIPESTNAGSADELQPAQNPLSPEVQKRHPLPPTPTIEERKVQTPLEIGNNTKVIDGYLHVWYIPCESIPSPANWVAPIIMTDLRSGSIVHLNRDGAIKGTDYRTEQGQDTLEAALKDSSIMEQVLIFPECPE